MLTVSFLDIVKAHKHLRGQVIQTPLIQSAVLSGLSGADVWMKLECQSISKSWKAMKRFACIPRWGREHPCIAQVSEKSSWHICRRRK